MKIAARAMINPYIYGSLLFDIEKDPQQENPINNPEIEKRMMRQMIDLMKENDAPPEQFERLGLPMDGEVKDEHLALKDKPKSGNVRIGNTEVVWIRKGKIMYESLLAYVQEPLKRQLILGIEERINNRGLSEVNEDVILSALMELSPRAFHGLFTQIGGIIKEKGKSI